METVTVASTTLFALAAKYLGDATQWNRIAALNGLSDPWLDGLTVIELPALDSAAGGGVGFD